MTTLDRVIEMQKQGLPETQITSQLQNEGFSPKDINESLNQAKIKNAVSPSEHTTQEMQPPLASTPEMYPPQGQEMQSSIMQPPKQPPTTIQTPETQTMQPPLAQEPETYPPQGQEMQQPQDDYYTQTPQAYSTQDYYTPKNTLDTETISEIAEQVTIEKLDEFKKKTGDLVSFKVSIQNKVADVDDRLKRIENSIDKLQQAIIGKVGELGENNAMIHKDLDNLHGTVAKLMNPLIDNYKELKKLAK